MTTDGWTKVATIASVATAIAALAAVFVAVYIARRQESLSRRVVALEEERGKRETEQHRQSQVDRLPQLRIRPGSLAGQGMPNGQPVFSIDVWNDGQRDATEVKLQATFEGRTQTSPSSVPIRAGEFAQPQVTVLPDWSARGGNTTVPGVTFRAYDEPSGAESSITIE